MHGRLVVEMPEGSVFGSIDMTCVGRSLRPKNLLKQFPFLEIRPRQISSVPNQPERG